MGYRREKNGGVGQRASTQESDEEVTETPPLPNVDVIEALQECLKRPGEVALRKKGGADIGAIKKTARAWAELLPGSYGPNDWHSITYPSFDVRDMVSGDGTPIAYEVVPVADVEAGK
jgi:hypothetical protein